MNKTCHIHKSASHSFIAATCLANETHATETCLIVRRDSFKSSSERRAFISVSQGCGGYWARGKQRKRQGLLILICVHTPKHSLANPLERPELFLVSVDFGISFFVQQARKFCFGVFSISTSRWGGVYGNFTLAIPGHPTANYQCLPGFGQKGHVRRPMWPHLTSPTSHLILQMHS